MQETRDRHTELLARAFKHKRSKKFDAEKADKIYFHNYKHPIEPIKNKRLDMLAVPNKFRQTSKYEEMELASTCVPRAALEANITPRLDHLARPFVRVLEALRRERTNLGKDYIQFLTDRIAMSLDTIYYHNVKSLMNIAEAKKKNRSRAKSVAYMKKTWNEMGDKERMEFLATAKKRWPPAPLPRRKWKKLGEFKRIEKLSVPLRFYKRPSQDSLILRLAINPLALKCKPSERTLDLAKVPARKLVKPWVPVAVKRSALFYILTERTTALAVPAPRARAVDSDLKENPYGINPFALKCKATPRTIELAKPIDR